jgi:hypothetical protein
VSASLMCHERSAAYDYRRRVVESKIDEEHKDFEFDVFVVHSSDSEMMMMVIDRFSMTVS